MVLTKRQNQIISILHDRTDWITGKEIALQLSVSDRTIRSDIEKINSFYHTNLIESSLHHGYHLNEDVYYTLNIDKPSSIPQTSEERCIYIIQGLLFENNEINVNNLQDQVYVGGYSIDNDIKRIKKILQPYDDLFLVRNKNFISLEGSEISKRKLYKELLAAETKGNFLNMNKLASLYKDFDLLMVKEILDETIQKYDFHIRESSIPILMMHIGIAMERIMHFSFVDSMKRNQRIRKSVDFQIADEFFHAVAKKIRMELIDDEIERLALLLMGKKSKDYTNFPEQQDAFVSIDSLVEGVLGDIYDYFDIDLRDDIDLKVGLQMHLQSLLERKKQQIHIDNVYLQEIKKKYPLVFEMGIRVARYFSERMKITIDENEVGFLALHLGCAYERSGESGKYRVLMIYPEDLAMSKMCEQKVETRFSGRIEVVGHLGVFEEQQVSNLHPDLILTTLPLMHNLKIPTVQISLFVNPEDEIKIFQVLNQLDKQKSKKEFEQMIVRLIQPEFFYRELDLTTPEEIITMMCERMLKHGYVKPGYKESVLQREEMSSTSFGFGFAIPHTLSDSAISSCMSIGILKNPITWGAYQVQLVILLAVKESDKKLLRIFFEWLSSVVSDSTKFSSLLEAKEHQAFIDCILA